MFSKFTSIIMYVCGDVWVFVYFVVLYVDVFGDVYDFVMECIFVNVLMVILFFVLNGYTYLVGACCVVYSSVVM